MNIQILSEFYLKILLNAWELYNDAKLLSRFGYFPRAYSLASLGLEETAKLTLLLYISMELARGKEFSMKGIGDIFKGKLFTNHRSKLLMVFLRLPGYDYQEAVRAVRPLNSLKNKSLYSDLFDGEIYKPSDFFGKKQSSDMIHILEVTLQKNLEELGVKSIKKVNQDLILAHYEVLRAGFDAMFDNVENINFIDLLKDIISEEEKFNAIKKSI